MPKVTPQSLTARERTFVTPDPVFTSEDGSVTFSMHVRHLTPTEYLNVKDMREQKLAEYSTGVGIKGSPDYQPPQTLMLNAEPVLVSRDAAEIAAALYRAQSCPDEDRYTWEEIVLFMTDPLILAQMMALYNELPQKALKKDPKEISGQG